MSARSYLELLRPANIVTALADVLAGYAIAGFQNGDEALPWLLASTACLYGSGVVLNDYFDRAVDRVERPERPIPSGRVPARHAALIGAILLTAGVLSASGATPAAAVIAVAIAAAVLLYDAWGKGHAYVGPANMGICRALNLLLGVAADPSALAESWPIALIPFAYIVGVTALSRGEVHGGGRGRASFALVSLGAALSALTLLVVRSEEPLLAGAVLVFLTVRVVPPFVKARFTPDAGRIRSAVRAGVLSLVLVNAVIGTAYAGPFYGAGILALGLLAGALARLFAVT